MDVLAHQWKRFWAEEEGATAAEYAVLLALILLVVIAAVAALGTTVSASFADTASKI